MEKFNLAKISGERSKRVVSPMQMIVSSFFAVIAVGTLLLMLPFSTVDGEMTFINALFTATSATCVTGLVVFDTFLKFTTFGKLVILTMIQVGGLGLVTFATFFTLIIRRKVGLGSLKLAGENSNMGNVAQMKTFIRRIIKITFAIEGIGAVLLAFAFVPQFGVAGLPIAVFTSISAFCNAGFDLFGFIGAYSSLTPFVSNAYVLAVVGLLIISGGLGFIVWQDMLDYKKSKKFSVHTKLVLLVTAFLIISGAVIFAVLEWNNAKTLGALSSFDKITNSMFQSITTRTAGFNSVDLSQCDSVTKIFMSVLMFIGAAPGSTGGGIKVTTMAILVVTVISVIRGREETTIFSHQINKKNVYRCLSIAILALLAVSVAIFSIYYNNAASYSGVDCVFEAVSAFATVGLSVGVTEHMHDFAKFITVFTMFIGRVGPVTMALSLAGKSANSKKTILPEGQISIG